MTAIDERALVRAVTRAMENAGTLPAKDSVKLVPEDWHRICDLVLDRQTALLPGSTGETEGWVLVPKEPSDGVLMSMAIRRDHGLGMPGYYDMLGDGEHANRLRVAITEARQAYEEVVGAGFYSKEREAEYRAMLAAAGGRDE